VPPLFVLSISTRKPEEEQSILDLPKKTGSLLVTKFEENWLPTQ
jgi:hypothetical protein